MKLILLSNSAVVPVIFLLFFFILIPLIIYFNKRVMGRAWDNMIKLSDQLGIKTEKPKAGVFSMPLPQFSGTYKNRAIKVYTEIRGSGKNRTAYSVLALTLSLRGSSTDITLYKEGFFSKIGKAFGMQDIQTGFDEFDKKFILRSKDMDSAKKIFDMQLTNKVLDTYDRMNAGIYIKNGIISYSETGYMSSYPLTERFRAVIDLCTAIAEQMERSNTHSSF